MRTEGMRQGRKVSVPSSRGTVTVAGVTLTHPNRILYPEQRVSKRDLASYYESVADWLMPHLIGRPLTLVRCPEGHEAECFYQKHANETVPRSIDRVQIQEDDGRATYMMANSISAVIGLVQMGVLEIHTWGSRTDRVDRPDRLILDLDPDPDLSWKHVIDVAVMTRTLLTELGLVSFVKTTGGKGLHIVLPLQRTHTWDEIKTFAKGVADLLARTAPDRVTSTMAKARRKRKIYVDYLRNTKGATAVTAFSTRAKPGAPISVPLTWDELSPDLRSDHFTVRNIGSRLKRLRHDPWRGYDTVKQNLTRAMLERLG